MKLPYRFVWRGLRIRLSRAGCANRPMYHIVAVDRHRGTNTPEIHEQLGTLDPIPNSRGEILCGINYEGIRKWMAKGATLSDPVAKLLGLSGYLPLHPMTYITARRLRENPDIEKRDTWAWITPPELFQATSPDGKMTSSEQVTSSTDVDEVAEQTT